MCLEWDQEDWMGDGDVLHLWHVHDPAGASLIAQCWDGTTV